MFWDYSSNWQLMIVQLGLNILLVGYLVQVATAKESCAFLSEDGANVTHLVECEHGCCGNNTENAACCQAANSENPLSPGEIVAISIGGYFGLMIIVVVAIKCFLSKNNKSRQRVKPRENSDIQYLARTSGISGNTNKNNNNNEDNQSMDYLDVNPYPRREGINEPYMFKTQRREKRSSSMKQHHLENYVATVWRDQMPTVQVANRPFHGSPSDQVIPVR